MAKKKRKPIRRKPQPADTREERNEVVLKPFLGMSPGLYLTILYSLLILFVLFMLLFYKGLRDRGEYLRVTTFPPGASVRVDGRYVGSSPCEVLVKQGDHTVTVSKPYYTAAVLEDVFRGPIFGTLFVRPRRILDIDLKLADPEALVRSSIEAFAANPHIPDIRIPEILLETVWAGNNSQSVTEELYYFIDKAKYFITDEPQLQRYLHALCLVGSGSGTMTPTSLLLVVDKIVQLNQKYENFPFWLSFVLKGDAANRIVDTPWFKRLETDYKLHYEQHRSRAQSAVSSSSGGASIVVQGLRFMNVPGGELLQGGGEGGFVLVQRPFPVAVPPFLIGESEVPNWLYKIFIEDEPEWALANKPSLIERGLVDEQYLSAWQNSDTQAEWEQLPVTNVSFYAAQAFCQWLTSKLPPAYSGYTARLPFESEWEWASRGGLVGADYPTGRPSAEDRFFSQGIAGPSPVGGSTPNGYGLQDIMGNVWEWCLDWYSPVKYLFSSSNPENNDFDSSRELPLGAEKVIRGGSWVNKQELIKVSTRGSQPPDWCTPYLGFRVILSRYVP